MVDSDIAKDSNTELTVLERIIDYAAELLSEKGISVPEHLCIEVGFCLTFFYMLLSYVVK